MNTITKPTIHAFVLDEIIKLIVAQYANHPDYYFFTKKGHFSFLGCNPDEHIEVRVRLANWPEKSDPGSGLSTRSVYLPTTMNDLSEGIYRVTFIVGDPSSPSHGIYQMLMHPEQYPDYTAEKAANDVIDFLLNERIDGTSLAGSGNDEASPENLVNNVQSLLTEISKLQPLSDAFNTEFPDGNKFIVEFTEAVKEWVANKPNAGMYETIELGTTVTRTGWFLIGYLYQTYADTRVEVDGIIVPVKEIINLINV